MKKLLLFLSLFAGSFAVKAQDVSNQVKPASQSEARANNENGKKNMPKKTLKMKRSTKKSDDKNADEPKTNTKVIPTPAKKPAKAINSEKGDPKRVRKTRD